MSKTSRDKTKCNRRAARSRIVEVDENSPIRHARRRAGRVRRASGCSRFSRRVVLAAALALSQAAAGCGSEPLDVAPSVDLRRFQGKWYEIARLPRATQTDCYGTTAFYSQGSDGAMQFVHQCNVGSPTGL